MPAAHPVLLILVSILIGLLFGPIFGGFWRTKRREIDNSLPGSHDDVLLGSLVFGAFAMGVFVTYALLYFSFF